MMLITVILSISTLLQFTAVLLVLRLAKDTKRSISWLFIAVAIFLMAIRRTIPLFRILKGDLVPRPDLTAELIALIISVLMVSGIALIIPLFGSTRIREKKNYKSGLLISVVGLFAGLSLLVWLNEIVDLPHILTGAPHTPFNWKEALLELAFIGLLGFFVFSKILYYIREHSRSEEALRESEARYRELFDNMMSGVAVYEVKDNGKDFIFKDFNKAAERIEKIKKEEVVGKSVTQAFPGVKDFGLFEVLQRVYKTGKAEHFPASLYEDERIAGWRKNYVYKLPSGEVVSVYDDVTEQKMMEKQTLHLNSVLRSIRNVNQIITVEKNRDRLLKRVCDSLIEIRGYHCAWILITDRHGRFVRSYESGMSEEFAAMLKYLERGEILFCCREASARSGMVAIEDPATKCGDCPLAHVHIDNGVIIAQLVHKKKVYGLIAAALPREFIIDAEEQDLFKEVSGDIAFALYNLDLEEGRKEAEKTARTLATVIKNSSDAITMQDLEGTITAWNQGAQDMYGWSEKEALTMNIRDLVPRYKREKSLELIKKVHNDESVESFETKRITKDGRVLDVWLTATKIVDEKGKPVGITTTERDVTERKKAVNEQKHLSRELLQKNRELEQMLYVISHDLRTPLVNIQGFSKELDLSIKELITTLRGVKLTERVKKKTSSLVEDDIKPSIEYILSSVSKMDTLLSGLLRLSRLGRQQIKIRKLNMNKLVSEIIDTFEFIIKEKGVRLEVEQLPQCKGDELQINQVFSNLLGNALKFLNPRRTGIISIKGKKEENHSLYYVKDNGIGIASKHREHIFELFHKLNPSKPGEGLGLSIVGRILDKHRGDIHVESKPEAGSTFIISLPNA